MMKYKEKLDIILNFRRIFMQSSSPDEFAVSCVLEGSAYMASKEFFNYVLFPFIFGSGISLRGEALRLRIDLRFHARKLNAVYMGLPDDGDMEPLRELLDAQPSPDRY